VVCEKIHQGAYGESGVMAQLGGGGEPKSPNARDDEGEQKASDKSRRTRKIFFI